MKHVQRGAIKVCLAIIVGSLGLAACTTTTAPLTPPPPAPPSAAAVPPTVAQAFQRLPGPAPQFAKSLSPHHFYMALEVKDLTPHAPTTCSDTSVLSWLRKIVKKDAVNVALTASVTDPAGDMPTSIPIYSASKDETASPAACATNILDKLITPYYLTDAAHPFQVTVSVKAANTTNVTASAEAVTVASTVLTYTGANGNLIKELGGAPITAITSAIDGSLSKNYSATSTDSYSFSIDAYPDSAGAVPQQSDWDAHKDAAEFGAPALQTSAWGVQIGADDRPTVLIYPTYLASMFGNGTAGQYPAPEDLMAQTLLPAGQGSLHDLLALGTSGVSTATSQSISDPTQMDGFCRSTRQLFAKFLTDDDLLAAQYAVLKFDTNYFTVAALRAAPNCLSDPDRARLLVLSPGYTLPVITPAIAANRDGLVLARTTAVAHALLNAGAPGALTAVISDPSHFQLVVTPELANAFPTPTEGKTWGGIGDDAVAQLSQLGILRVGCGVVTTNQTAKVIAGIALMRTNGIAVAIMMTFTNDDPAVGAADAAAPALASVKFYPLQTAKDFMGPLTTFPAASCALA
jgi:hypothetical protein